MIAVRITDLVIGKIFYKGKMRIQTFHKIDFKY